MTSTCSATYSVYVLFHCSRHVIVNHLERERVCVCVCEEGGERGLTVRTPSISSPLAAKSVASKNATFPSLNIFKASSLYTQTKTDDHMIFM